MPTRSQVDAAVEEGGGREDFFAEFGGVQHFPGIGGADDRECAALAEEIDLAVTADGGCVVVSGPHDAAGLPRLSGDGVEAGKNAAVLEREDATVVEQRGRTERREFVVPPGEVN